ncbi:hypothetical protein TMA_080 [Thermus phage TMA]|uniref:hypothetical protein n=1 Tax=Thermus phage TMA TaxID=699370 RepID=UPI00021AADC1|nr:hypothetical protein TMA_080 [Thermus phage TMA]BAK53768.1 hypothetical protein TMA_080 [Thermus phage TMA]
MATDCIQKQSEQKNTELTYWRVSEEGFWNPFYQTEAFLEKKGEIYLLQTEYLNYLSDIGGVNYRLKLYKLIDGCTTSEGNDCLEAVAVYNPINDLLSVITNFYSHPFFSNETGFIVKYYDTNDDTQKIIFKTEDGFYYVEKGLIYAEKQDGSTSIYLFYDDIYFIYKITSSSITLEGIYHPLSLYPQVPHGNFMGITHLKDNVFLASYLRHDYNSESFTLDYTYHVFSIGLSNGQPSITPIKVETRTENHLKDTSYLLENFSINLDVYDNNYYSVYTEFVNDTYIRKIYSNETKFLEPYSLYVSTSVNGKSISLYLGYIRVVSLDDNFNFSFSNYIPFVRENPKEFYKFSYLASLGSNSTYTNNVNIYDDILHSELYYKKNLFFAKEKNNKLVIFAYPRFSDIFDTSSYGGSTNSVLGGNSYLDFYPSLPSVLIFTRDNSEYILNAAKKSGCFKFIATSGSIEIHNSELPLFEDKKQSSSPGNPPGLVIKQEFNEDICSILSSKHPDIDYTECLSYHFYKSIYTTSNDFSVGFVEFYKDCIVGIVFTIPVARNPGLQGNQNQERYGSILVDEFYITVALYVDTNDPSNEVKVKILDAGKLYTIDSSNEYYQDNYFNRRNSIVLRQMFAESDFVENFMFLYFKDINSVYPP